MHNFFENDFRPSHRGGPHRHHRRHVRGGFPGHGPGPRGRRAARGDVRAAILLLLAEEPRNGYALMQAIEERTGGLWRPSPGSMYPALSLLEDEGLVRAQEAGTGRVFELTDAGRAHIEEHKDRHPDPFAAVAGEVPESAREMRKVFGEIAQIALGQIPRQGTPEQIEQAAAVLVDARRRLYLILAGEEA